MLGDGALDLDVAASGICVMLGGESSRTGLAGSTGFGMLGGWLFCNGDGSTELGMLGGGL